MVSRVPGTWFRHYSVHGFRGTGVQGTWYIVSHYPFERDFTSSLLNEKSIWRVSISGLVPLSLACGSEPQL